MLDLHNNRFLLSELLQPPLGYRFDRALITTYSLDLCTLLAVPLKLMRGEDPEGELGNIMQLQALREYGDRLRVFCQFGRILYPPVQHQMLAWLEDVVREVAPPRSGSFHPKLWVIRYEARDTGPVKFRCLIGSRNLTYDQSADVMVSMDGEVGPIEKEKAGPLAEFFSELCEIYDPGTDHSVLLGELSRVEFSTDGQFEEFQFRIKPENRQESWIPEDKCNGAMVISPFLTASVIEEMAGRSSEPLLLVSRANELAKLSFDTLNKVEAYHLKESVIEALGEHEEEELAIGDSASAAPPRFDDIHLKLYAYTIGYNQHLVIGSANSTYKASLGNNVESMLHLRTRHRSVSRFSLRDQLDLENPEGFFKRYEYREDFQEKEDDAEKMLDHMHRNLTEYLAGGNHLYGSVTQNGKFFQLAITVDLAELAVNDEKFQLAAAHLNRLHHPQVLTYGSVNSWELSNLALSEVSRWLLLRLSHPQAKQQRNFVVKLHVDGIPSDRDDSIFTSLIKDSDTFFRYLYLLLAEVEEWIDQPLEGEEAGSGYHWGDSWIEGQIPLFEELARQLALSPSRVERVDQFIKLVEADKNLSALDIDDFMKFWRGFREAVTKTQV